MSLSFFVCKIAVSYEAPEPWRREKEGPWLGHPVIWVKIGGLTTLKGPCSLKCQAHLRLLEVVILVQILRWSGRERRCWVRDCFEGHTG